MAFRFPNYPAVDIFCQNRSQESPTLLCSRDLGIHATALDDLERRGHQFLYVRTGDFKQVSETLYESLEDIVVDPSVPCAQRFSILQSAIAMEVEVAFQQTDNSRLISLASQVGSQLTKLLTESPIVPQELFDMARHDLCTFVHITNVTAYAVVLARQLGINDSKEIEKIAAGAMLHDLGKRFIPDKILAKPGRLTPEERQIIESHPLLGYRELSQGKELDFGQLMMVYQHHERADGTGYPVGIPEEEIHPWAKILSVVDVFDAITAKRPYRKPTTPSEALLYLAENAKTQFSPEVVLCWISTFQQN